MATPSGSHAIEVAWDDVFDSNFPASSTRPAWRHAVAAVAEKAKATLPACSGRIDAAVKLVLAGDVDLLDDGTASVASQSDGHTTYHVVNGDCTCQDFPRAPEHFCKHRLAYGIMKRATQLLQATEDTSPPASAEPTWVDRAKQHPQSRAKTRVPAFLPSSSPGFTAKSSSSTPASSPWRTSVVW
jgi:hypothetical protein